MSAKPAASSPSPTPPIYTTRELKGSGIGLWLISEVIARHHGRIRVCSRTEAPWRGTLFDVFLPEYRAS